MQRPDPPAAKRPTWRLGFTVEVFADNETEATEKARRGI